MIVVAGHVCLDVIPRLDRDFEPAEGALYEIGPATFSVGGPVGNVGGALVRLGIATRLVGRIGHDPFGGVVESLLAEFGGRMQRNEDVETSYSLVIDPPGADRTFLHYPGANDTFGGEDLRAALEDLRDERPDVLHFGYPPIMRAIFEDGGRALADAFAFARSLGVRVVLDTSTPDPHGPAGAVDWAAFLRTVLPHVDAFVPSWDDLVGMLPGLRVRPSTRDVRGAAEACLSWGAGAVLVKFGGDGAYLRTASPESYDASWHHRELWSPNYEVEVRGTTGAGDATNAGFLMGLERGEGPEAALCLASAAGACSVEGFDATSRIPGLAVLQARIDEGWKRSPSRLAEGRSNPATGLVVGELDGR